MSKKRSNKATAPAPANVRFVFGGKKHVLPYEKAFTYGHQLLRGEHYGSAATIFRELAKVKGRGPRAKIMLAQCEACQQNYDTCKDILTTVFKNVEEPPVEELQSAFVYHRLGMQNEAIKEMAKVVREHPNIPSACLSLGDMFLTAGLSKQAEELWKLAIKRDRRSGAVAKAAQKQRERLRKKRTPSKKKKRQ